MALTANFGNTANPPNGSYYYVTSGKNQYASAFTMPTPGGFIKTIYAYFDLYSGSGTCYVCVWDGSGNLLGDASLGTIGTGSFAINGQAWHSASLSGNGVWVAGGSTVYLGIWTPGNCLWTSDPSGTAYSNASGSPGSFASHGVEQGAGFPVYANYTLSEVKIRRSNVWKACPLYVRRSGAWVPATLRVRRGTGWTSAS